MQSEGTTCCLLFEFRRTRSASRCGLAFLRSSPDGRKARSLSAQRVCQYRAKMAGLKQEGKRHKLNIFLQPIDWREITDIFSDRVSALVERHEPGFLLQN